MKAIITILSVVSALISFGQFPAPSQLEYYSVYIMIDEEGYCAGEWLAGPTYCSHFNWNAPDTNSTSANFEHYNLYCYSYISFDTVVLATLTETYFEIELGLMGEVWVTATYSNPEGESDTSNIIINFDLPMSIEENKSYSKDDISYDRKSEKILITTSKSINKINLYNVQGRLIKTASPNYSEIKISEFNNGVYIVEVLTVDKQIIRYKIVK